MFWCFQAAHEFQGLAEDLSSISRVSGMRSGHLTDVDIYSNPALLHQIAQLYFQEIIELQPTGPYCIGGNCQGAILANAIAWQLVAHGAEVKPLIMMETSLKSILDFGIRWNGALALLYGKESRMNPFRHHNIPNKASGEGGSNLDRVVASSPTDILKRVFSGPFSITEIEGSHGTFFNNHNRQSLSKAITTLLSS